MPPTTGTSEEIIEKRDSSPLATSCIILSVVAVFAAIILQLKEISALNQKDVDKIVRGLYAKEVEQDLRSQQAAIQEAIRQTDVSPQIIARVEDILKEPIQFPAAGAGEDEETEEGGMPPAEDDEALNPPETLNPPDEDNTPLEEEVTPAGDDDDSLEPSLEETDENA